MVLSPHGNARYLLDGNRLLLFWYMLPWYSAPTVMHGIFFMVSTTLVHFPAVFSHHSNVWYTWYVILYIFWVTPACVWCCDEMCPIYSGRRIRWKYRSESHRISHPSTFLLRCVPLFVLREGLSRSFPSSTVESNFVY